jgi:acetyl esterase
VALDDASTALLAQMAEGGGRPLTEMAPADARAMGAAMVAMYGPGPDMNRVFDEQVIGVDGEFRVRVLVPVDVPRAAIVYLHGGGWVLGSIEEFDTLGRILAARTECAVVLVDYRLAPEHRYPSAVEDAWAAVRWTDDHLEEIAGLQVPVLVAGDSSGGNLAAVVAQRAAACGAPRLTAQVLVYPVTDADLDTASYTDAGNQLIVSRDSMSWFWDQYVPDPAHRTDPGVSPLRAADLAGLPPAVVITAEHDVMRDEGEAYVDKLRAAGVPVEHQRFGGQLHGFFTMVAVLPGSAAGMDFVVAHIRRLLDAPTRPNVNR